MGNITSPVINRILKSNYSNDFFINKYNSSNLYSSIRLIKKFIHLIFRYSILYTKYFFYTKTFSNVFILSTLKKWYNFKPWFFVKAKLRTSQRTMHDLVKRKKKRIIYFSKIWCFKFRHWIIFIRYFFQPFDRKKNLIKFDLHKKFFNKPLFLKNKITLFKYKLLFTKIINKVYNF